MDNTQFIILAMIMFIVIFIILNRKEKQFKKAGEIPTKEDRKKADIDYRPLNFGKHKLIPVSQLQYMEHFDKVINLKVGPFIGIDAENKTFVINYKKNTYKYKFSDIIDFELSTDANQVITGTALSTMAGGMLFGPLGALAGASSGRKIKKKKPTWYYFNLMINDLNNGNLKMELTKHVGEESIQELTNALTFILNNK